MVIIGLVPIAACFIGTTLFGCSFCFSGKGNGEGVKNFMICEGEMM